MITLNLTAAAATLECTGASLGTPLSEVVPGNSIWPGDATRGAVAVACAPCCARSCPVPAALGFRPLAPPLWLRLLLGKCQGGLSTGGLSEADFGHKRGPHWAISDDTPASKSYGFRRDSGQLSSLKDFRKAAKTSKNQKFLDPPYTEFPAKSVCSWKKSDRPSELPRVADGPLHCVDLHDNGSGRS